MIRSKILNKVKCSKSSVSIKIIFLSCPDISFHNKQLETDVDNNMLNKLEEKEKDNIAIYDDISSLSSIENTIFKRGGSIGSKKRSRCERLTDMLMNCGSLSSQINTIRQVMKGPLISQTLAVLNSRSSQSSEQYSPTLVDLEKIIKCNCSKILNTRRRLLRKTLQLPMLT